MFAQLNQVSPCSFLFSRILVTMCVIQLLVNLIYFGHLCNVCFMYREEPGLDDLAAGDFERGRLDPLLASLQCEGL